MMLGVLFGERGEAREERMWREERLS